MTKRIADYIIDRINQEGVEQIFMVTGWGILFLTDAVAANKNIEGISVHHEQSGAYAANAYAEYNGKLGACLVSVGCGSTNAITGVLNAWQDNIPVVYISGQNIKNETTRFTGLNLRTYGNQEADIVSLVKPITKYATMIEDPQMIAYEIDKAIHLATTGRKGPVWIDIPIDIQNMRIEEDSLMRYSNKNSLKNIEFEDVIYIKEALEESKRPVILIGNGLRLENAIDKLKDLANKYEIPVVSDNSGIDNLKSDSVNYMGTVGSIGGNRLANFTVQNADLILSIGSILSPITTGDDYDKFAREAKVVVVDIDHFEHQKETITIDKLIVANFNLILEELLKLKLNLSIDEWIIKTNQWRNIFPKCEIVFRGSDKVDMYELAEVFSSTLPNDAVILSDAGLEELIFPSSIELRKSQRYIHPVYQGSMGTALPGSIGAYYASNKPIVVIVGDGSFMMNVQELQTIRYKNLPIKIFVINNNAYAVIRKRQQFLFRNRTIGTDSENGVDCTDIERLARAFDIAFQRIENTESIKEKVENVLSYKGSIICEIIGLENQEYIHTSYARTNNKKFVKRPLEDQKPFIERELFLKEMIIEPIDQ